MCKCPKCGTEMEAKGRMEDACDIQRIVFQCPECKNIEMIKRQTHAWFRLEYP